MKDPVFVSLVNLQDIRGNTAMHLAAEKGHHEIMEVLLATNHCNVTLKNEDERALVHLSARTGRPSVRPALKRRLQGSINCANYSFRLYTI